MTIGMVKDERMLIALEGVAASLESIATSLKAISYENDEPGVVWNSETGHWDVYILQHNRVKLYSSHETKEDAISNRRSGVDFLTEMGSYY